ncbi:hypothetical protein ACVIGB_000514 [Bradyrhizobium sp. USDA 4341]
MSETIGVTYKPVALGGYHMAIFYTNAAGASTIIEAYATVPGPATSASEIVNEEAGHATGSSPFGTITGIERAWNSQFSGNGYLYQQDDLLPQEVLLQGGDLSAAWSSIEASLVSLKSSNYVYMPLLQNSNTFVTAALLAAGLTKPSGIGVDVEGNTAAYWTPAADKSLLIHVGDAVSNSDAMYSTDENAAASNINLLQNIDDAGNPYHLTIVDGSTIFTSADGHIVQGMVNGGVVSIDPSQFSYLASGESNAVTISYLLSDGQGAAAESVVLQVAGANDAPTETTADAAATVDFSHTTASGKVTFSDPDLADAHVIKVKYLDDSPQLGVLTASVSHDTKGTGAGGEITWQYDLTHAVPSTPKVEHYELTLDDGHGGTAVQDVAVTIGSDAASSLRFPTDLVIESNRGQWYTAPGPFAVTHSNDVGSILTDGYSAGSGRVVSYSFKVEGGGSFYIWNNQEIDIPFYSTFYLSQPITVIGTPLNQYGLPDATLPQIEATFTLPLYDSQFAGLNAPYQFSHVAYTILPPPEVIQTAATKGNGNADGSFAIAGGDIVDAWALPTPVASPLPPGSGSFGAWSWDGTVYWNYSRSPDLLHVLQVGQTNRETFAIEVRGVDGSKILKDVTLTTTRNIDQTTISGSSQSIERTANYNYDAAAGTVSFADPNASDRHVMSAKFISSDYGSVPAGNIVIDGLQDSTDSSIGSASWHYDMTNQKALAVGATGHETWALYLDNGNGGFTEQDVTIDLTRHDAPEDIHVVDVQGNPTPVIAYPGVYMPNLGYLAGSDDNPSVPVTFALSGMSAVYFTLQTDAHGTYLAPNYAQWENYDYNAPFPGDMSWLNRDWWSRVSTSFWDKTPAQIDALLSGGVIQDHDTDGSLASHLANTPYMATVVVTDANGVSTTQNIYLDLNHDLRSDLSGVTVSAVSSLSETASIGTVVASLAGMPWQYPWGIVGVDGTDMDPTGHFAIQDQKLVLQRPLDDDGQTHYDLALAIANGQTVTVPIDVVSANLQSGNIDGLAFAQVTDHTAENPTADVLIANFSIPPTSTTTFLLDTPKDDNGRYSTTSFEFRSNADGTESLWLKGGAYLDREALGMEGILHLDAQAIVADGGVSTRTDFAIDLHVDNVHEGLEGGGGSGQYLAGVLPAEQHDPGLWIGAHFSFLNGDFYDTSYTVSLVPGADDSDLFAIGSLQQVPGTVGVMDAEIVPLAVLDSRPYTVDVQVHGSDGTETISQVTINTAAADPSLFGYRLAPGTAETFNVDTHGVPGVVDQATLDVPLQGYADLTDGEAPTIALDTSNTALPGTFQANFVPASGSEGAHVVLSYTGDDGDLFRSPGGQNYLGTLTINDNGRTSQAPVYAVIHDDNVAPAISEAPQSASISGDQGGAAQSPIYYSDSFHFTDANLSDTHVVSASFVSSDYGDGAHSIGSFAASLQTDSTSNPGTVGWTYAINRPDQIPQGDFHEVYDVAVADAHGAVAHQQVSVTLSHHSILV